MAVLRCLSGVASGLGVGTLGIGQAAIARVSNLSIDPASLSGVCIHRSRLEGSLVVKEAVADAVAYVLTRAGALAATEVPNWS